MAKPKQTKKPKQEYGSRTFEALDDNQQRLYIAMAEVFIAKQGWTFADKDRTELIYITALYLHHARFLLSKDRIFPCYSVHCFDDGSRSESTSRSIVYNQFKIMSGDGMRVAMFHWTDKHAQTRLYASDGYPYARDFGPEETA